MSSPLDYFGRSGARLAEQFKPRARFTSLRTIVDARATELEQALIDTKAARDLATAAAAQLDEIGRMYRETRDGEADAVYRARLLAMVQVVDSKSRPDDLLQVVVAIDDGFALAAIAYVPLYPAAFIITAEVPAGNRARALTMSRLTRRGAPAGVNFQLHVQQQGVDLFVWDGDTGEGFALESDLVNTGGVWAEAL